jgi:hypothetical protein
LPRYFVTSDVKEISYFAFWKVQEKRYRGIRDIEAGESSRSQLHRREHDQVQELGFNTEVIYVIVQGLLKGYCMMDYNINLLGINQSMKFKTALHAGLF